MNVLEGSWTGRFFNDKHWDFLTIPLNRPLLCFPPECKDFDGSVSQNRPISSALKISFSWYLANVVGKVVSSLGAVISLVTISDYPDLFESNAMSKDKMKNVIIHLTLFWFELQSKAQGKYDLPFLPASQPSVRCCKIVVIEGLSKFMSFLQKNRTIDWNVVTTH